MSREDDVPGPLRQLYAEMIEAEMTDRAEPDHVAPEELFAYHDGELPPPEAARVQEHVAHCRDCADALLDVELLATPTPAGEVDFETAAAWRAFSAEPEVGLGPQAAVEPVAAGPVVTRWPVALAAALALVALGLGVWAWQEHRTAEALRTQLAAVQVNVPILYLDAVTRAAVAPPAVELGEGDVQLLLIVTPSREAATYRATLIGRDGARAWDASGLVASEYGTLRLAVPRSRVPPGDYRLELAAGDGSGAGTYELSVGASGGG